MSNYRRFITYLFRYENGEKMEQCGYARVEQKQNLGKIEFHIKNCGMIGGEVLPRFFAKSGQVQVPIGCLAVKGHGAEGSFQFECSRMGGTRYDFSDMRGLVIPLEGQQLIISQWDDEVYQWEALMAQPVQQPDEWQLNGDLQLDGVPQEKEVIEADIQAQGFAASADQQLSSTEATHPLAELHSLQPKIYPFEGDQSVWAVQAQLRDIKHLPKECWSLGNNSFVLRGYFHFGSILIGYMEREKSYFLGIPGIFQSQEKVIASLFGFDHFRGKKSAEEKPGNFGYWYKVLDVVS